ncbi:MAG: hypothetical protein ACT6S0_13465 [Roseateles sp.]|uniref:hypothetical protein n=1 Tax=Roseateles sp. TaxID=1971397 RepID=UPI00403502C4
MQRGFRRVLAALQQEALVLLDTAHRPVAQLTPLPPRRLIALLRMPTPERRQPYSPAELLHAQAGARRAAKAQRPH